MPRKRQIPRETSKGKRAVNPPQLTWQIAMADPTNPNGFAFEKKKFKDWHCNYPGCKCKTEVGTFTSRTVEGFNFCKTHANEIRREIRHLRQIAKTDEQLAPDVKNLLQQIVDSDEEVCITVFPYKNTKASERPVSKLVTENKDDARVQRLVPEDPLLPRPATLYPEMVMAAKMPPQQPRVPPVLNFLFPPELILRYDSREEQGCIPIIPGLAENPLPKNQEEKLPEATPKPADISNKPVQNSASKLSTGIGFFDRSQTADQIEEEFWKKLEPLAVELSEPLNMPTFEL